MTGPAIPAVPVAIEPAGPTHDAVLAELQARIFPAGALSWPAAAWRQWLGAPAVVALIARAGDEPLGLALGRVVAGEAEVLTLGVVPSFRRRGLGRALLNRLLAGLGDGGASRVVLEVAADNDAALALYRAAAFRATGRRPGYYVAQGRSTDAQILEWAPAATPDG